MAESELYFSLLRVSAAQALRAAGLTTAKPSVLDAFTDITLRYLTLLGTTTRTFAESSNRSDPAITDVRAAMEHLGLIHPVSIFRGGRRRARKRRRVLLDPNEAAPTTTVTSGNNFSINNSLNNTLEFVNSPGMAGDINRSFDMMDSSGFLGHGSGYSHGVEGGRERGLWGDVGDEGEEEDDDEDYDDEDTRGVDALIEWFKGPVAAEMRRVAGITTISNVDAGGVGVGSGNEISGGAATALGAPGVPVTISTMVVNSGGGVPGAITAAPASTGGGVGTGGVLAPGGGSGEVMVETGPITWLHGLKNKPERWKGTAIGPPADDTSIRIEGGGLGEDVFTVS